MTKDQMEAAVQQHGRWLLAELLKHVSTAQADVLIPIIYAFVEEEIHMTSQYLLDTEYLSQRKEDT